MILQDKLVKRMDFIIKKIIKGMNFIIIKELNVDFFIFYFIKNNNRKIFEINYNYKIKNLNS